MSTDKVVVYTSPTCYPCRATKHKLNDLGIDFTEVDITEDHDARAYLVSLGHTQTPVVESPAGSWSGYKPDRLLSLA